MRTAICCGLVLALAGGLTAADPAANELQAKLKKLNQDVRSEDDFSAAMKELLKDKKATAALVKEAAAMQRAAKADAKPFRFFPALALGRAAQFAKNHEAAELFYRYCTDTAVEELKSTKLIAVAGENLLDFLWARKKYEQVNELCQTLLQVDGDEQYGRFKIDVIERQVQALAKLGETDKALAQADKLVQAFDGHWQAVSIKAQVLREAGKFADAVKAYEQVIEKVKKDDDVKEDGKKQLVRNVRYMISGLYMEADDVDKSAGVLQDLIKESPDTATYYNDLGFIWADHGLKLEESEKLIRKAIELDLAARKKLADEGKLTGPAATTANAAYVDSLGWVLFKQKKYDEAIKHLLAAATSDDDESDHIEIWDHVGDCYAAMGKKKEALDAFQKGMKADDVTKKDVERRRKVAEKIRKLKADTK